MISLLVGFRFFYDDWGSMIAIFFTIASAFIQIDAALGAKPLAARLTPMNQRMLNDQKLPDIFQRFYTLLIGKIENPVHVEG